MSRPIGYWVKLVDRRLEDGLNAVLAEHGVTRRQWQVLNALEGGARDATAVVEALLPFADDAGTVRAELGRLVDAGRVSHGEAGHLEITPAGAALLVALTGDVDRFRERTSAGLTRDAYETTVATLERIAENLA
jgi:hypothetical protein